MKWRPVLLLLLTSAGMALSLIALGRSHKIPEPAPEPEPPMVPLTAEAAKAALVELIRTTPNTFAVRIDPDDFAARSAVNYGGERYQFGGFGIDIPARKYQLTLVPKPDSRACLIDYRGEFVFAKGRWVAREPLKTYSLGGE